MKKFVSLKRKTVDGRRVFLVTMPPSGGVDAVLGKRVEVDGRLYRCVGIESRGVALPGREVCLIAQPLKKR